MKIDQLHLKAPGSWINDPNGFIYYQGEYHLFYQYFPYDTMWGTMHWGHAVSQDLIDWEHRGIALFPSKGYDRNGCFSGSAIEAEGKLYLYYTGVKYEAFNEENVHLIVDQRFESSQALLVSEDGMTFDNLNKKRMILPPILDPQQGDRAHTRDPKVWKSEKGYYMVLGTRSEGQGKLLFYRSEDLLHWHYVNSYSRPDLGHMWECPDLFPLTDQEGQEHTILLMSPEGVHEGALYSSHALCSLVSFQEENAQLEITKPFQMVDYGQDLYAPQTNLDAEGRRVMIAWMRMPKRVESAGEKPWIGMMCLPRVIEVTRGHIYFRVHPQVMQSFKRELSSLQELDYSKPFHISVSFATGDAMNIGGYRIALEQGALCTDRSKVFEGLEGSGMQFHTPEIGSACKLDIFVEPNLIEIFVNEGEYVLSNIVYGLRSTLSSTTFFKVWVQ
ncbi:sucrose-6-phosphate hydrolase [Paenibacillus sp. CAA11]|uniref:glycoside hydrolase family 32 protein n=1 Tax=Paenibacillus sp. CAA11 TaxID=1532905 RepID=UPI000D3CA95E|nr:glycoside hydrolase family 32 protein [Paenibacillus sp. CAA11]AWB43470.1 sucrose-6-phosphate hydrolase [Paenibacillus sp. CAA11]